MGANRLGLANRLRLPRRTVFCVWWKQRMPDSYQTQHSVRWWRRSLSVARQCLIVERGLKDAVTRSIARYVLILLLSLFVVVSLLLFFKPSFFFVSFAFSVNHVYTLFWDRKKSTAQYGKCVSWCAVLCEVSSTWPSVPRRTLFPEFSTVWNAICLLILLHVFHVYAYLVCARECFKKSAKKIMYACVKEKYARVH